MSRKRNANSLTDHIPPIWTPLFINNMIFRMCTSALSNSTLAGTLIYISRIGESTLYGGIMISIFTATTIIIRAFSGALVDLLSRRYVALIGAFLVCTGAALSVFVSSFATHCITYAMVGSGFALMHTAVASITSDIIPISRLGEGMSYTLYGQTLGIAIAPPLAIWFTGFEDPNAFLIGLSSLGAMTFIISISIRFEKHPEILHETSRYRLALEMKKQAQSRQKLLCANFDNTNVELDLPISQKKRNRFFEVAAFPGALPMLAFAIGTVVFNSYAALFGYDVGYSNPGMFFTIAALFTIFIRLFISKIFDTHDPRQLFLMPILIGISAFLGICFIHNEYFFYALGIGYGFAVAVAIPVMNTTSVRMSPHDRSGPANALFYLIYDIGVALGSVIWSGVYQLGGSIPLFMGGVLCYIIAYLVSLKTLSGKNAFKKQ